MLGWVIKFKQPMQALGQRQAQQQQQQRQLSAAEAARQRHADGAHAAADRQAAAVGAANVARRIVVAQTQALDTALEGMQVATLPCKPNSR